MTGDFESNRTGVDTEAQLSPIGFPVCAGSAQSIVLPLLDEMQKCCEAVRRPTMKFAVMKTADPLDLQALHRVRERLIGQRVGIIYQMHAFLLERGIAVRQGLRL